MLILRPITHAFVNGRHQSYITPGISPRPASTLEEAEEVMARMFRALGAVSQVEVTDGDGVLRIYRRCDFFLTDRSSRKVHAYTADRDVLSRLVTEGVSE